jgi:hypothetical protein
MSEDIIPDVSLGTHFFNELVEAEMLYMALFPNQEKNIVNEEVFIKTPNKLPELLPEEKQWAEVVKVVDISDLSTGENVTMNANTLTQRAVCYFEKSN